jgi:hypothetical protein
MAGLPAFSIHLAAHLAATVDTLCSKRTRTAVLRAGPRANDIHACEEEQL